MRYYTLTAKILAADMLDLLLLLRTPLCIPKAKQQAVGGLRCAVWERGRPRPHAGESPAVPCVVHAVFNIRCNAPDELGGAVFIRRPWSRNPTRARHFLAQAHSAPNSNSAQSRYAYPCSLPT